MDPQIDSEHIVKRTGENLEKILHFSMVKHMVQERKTDGVIHFLDRRLAERINFSVAYNLKYSN